jgi:hypothetical protein
MGERGPVPARSDQRRRRNAGEPVAIPHPNPWIQIAAVNLAQTRTTMTLIPGMLAPAAISTYGIDLGKEVIYSRTGGQIQAVTSSPLALEGGRPSLFVANETQHWLSNNDGHAMARVGRRNLAKSRDGSARLVEITNAHEPGIDSVAERSFEAYQAIAEGRTRGRGLLYDSREAPPETILSDPASLRAGLRAAYGDSTWADLDRLTEEIYDRPEHPTVGGPPVLPQPDRRRGRRVDQPARVGRLRRRRPDSRR